MRISRTSKSGLKGTGSKILRNSRKRAETEKKEEHGGTITASYCCNNLKSVNKYIPKVYSIPNPLPGVKAYRIA